ncbi:amino acid adenylation domain-containing protein [Microbulbifer spongiae]|uniref:Amino acid adenylation domain-containing protein n=1 Tax=Microbulbifer spongiae TaxID=2944933 RepID=A0ABY9EJP6_9GAMM|nr:amino acid adenylation domain-containing protein [Microbulbifer sp. MI-G]WKD51531.1 amino acid adenylation domain-containing protein [Microbulbifer sp. MI-G]
MEIINLDIRDNLEISEQPIEVIKENSQFDKKALNNLSKTDQVKFEAYGKGPEVSIPYQMIHQVIECQALKQQTAVAVIHKHLKITYGELNRQANCIAEKLTKLGVGPGDNVGLFLERSISMVVGILGILKTGAAYVPQDVRITPKSTLLKVMEIAKIKVNLTLSHLIEKIPFSYNQMVLTIDDMDRISNKWKIRSSVKKCERKFNPNTNCFILFTSGTTGTPNGVQVTHDNVCNILLSKPGSLGIKPGYKVSQLLNIAFDMAAWEILGCLAHGGTLMIRGSDFTEVARQCDVIIATPSILAKIDSSLCNSTRTVAVAGEPCPKPLVEQWATKCQFINSYGPTETTIINTAQPYFSCPYSLTVGKPTPNNTVYLLDENLQPCTVGSIGEIWAGGKGVTAGYINNNELTRERFQPDPFIANGGMMFRTRDLGRWSENGELEHWGRTDDQVKIKGFRVELDSISTVTESVKGCQQAVTLKVSNEKLVTFVTPKNVDTQRCMDTIGATLPYYCLPYTIVALSEFPMTDRGKIDKQALRAQIQAKVVSHYS